MNLADLASAVYTRLTGDSTLTGYLGGGIRHFYNKSDQPENSKTAYAVYTLDIGDHEFSSRGSVWDIDTTVTVSVPRETTYATQSAALERVYGDAEEQTTVLPSFGLHRWTPTLASGNWTAGIMVCIDGSTLTTDPDWFHAALVFRCRLSREAPTS